MSTDNPISGVPEQSTPDKLEATFRNGSITAMGIILGFSLSFFTNWTLLPGKWIPWNLITLITLFLLGGGVTLQIFSLYKMFLPESLIRTNYSKAICIFMWGILIVFFGVIVTFALDAIFGVPDRGAA